VEDAAQHMAAFKHGAAFMTDIFISYSRRDKVFAEQLRAALVAQGRSVWIDTADIPPTSPWRQDIADAIAAAGAVLIILSPDWLTSEVSQRELHYAIDMKKKLIPVVYRDVEPRLVHPALANLNWIFSRPTDDQGRAWQQIVFAIDTDLDYWREGSDLLVRAQQWTRGDRRPAFTLRGEPLRKAEQWLAAGATKSPGPSPLQVEFITAGRQASARRQRVMISALSVGIAVTLILSLVAGYFAIQTNQENQLLGAKAIAANALSALQANDNSRALLLAKEAYRLDPADPVTRGALFSAVSASPHLVSILRSNDAGQLNSTDAISAVAYSGDGKTLVTIDFNHILVWDMTTNHVRLTISGQGAFRGDLSKDGQIIAAQASGDAHAITLLNAQTGATIGTLDGTQHETSASNTANHSLTFSPDNKLIAATDCGDDSCTTHRILLWDVAARRLLYQIPVPFQPTQVDLAFSPDSTLLAFTSSESSNGTTRSSFTVWNIAQQHTLSSHTAPDGEDYLTVAFTPHGKTLLVGGRGSTSGKISIWNIAKQQFANVTFIDPDGWIQSLVISADANWFVTITIAGEIQLWLADSGVPDGLPLVKGSIGFIAAVAFSPDSVRFVAASTDNRLSLWSTRSFTSLGPDPVTQLFNDTRSAVSPDGTLLAATDFPIGSEQEQIALWDLKSGMLSKTITTPITDIYTFAFSPDGRTLAVGGYGGELAVIDVGSGAVEGKPWAITDVPDPSSFRMSTDGQINALEFSPDGRYLLAISFDSGVAVLWDVPSHAFVAVVGERAVPLIAAAAFLSNDEVVFGGATNNTPALLGIWNLAQRKVMATWQYKKGSAATIDAIAADPSKSAFAVADDAGVLTVWDAIHHRLLTQINTNQLEISPGVIQFSSDGNLLLFSAGTTVEIWKINGKSVEPYIQPITTDGLTVGATITSGNTYLVISTSAAGGGTTVQYLQPSAWETQACAIANRDLTRDEWQQFIAPNRPDVAYTQVCRFSQ
jgi:WD40 repeat protein